MCTGPRQATPKTWQNAIGEGVKAAGKEAAVLSVDALKPEELQELPAFAPGLPGHGG